MDALTVIKLTASAHWKKHSASPATSGRASFFLCLPLDSWRKRPCCLKPNTHYL